MRPDFGAASDRLTHSVTLAHIAGEMGIAQVTIRHAYLHPRSSSDRGTPDGWKRVIAKLATGRAVERTRLAEEPRAEADR